MTATYTNGQAVQVLAFSPSEWRDAIYVGRSPNYAPHVVAFPNDTIGAYRDAELRPKPVTLADWLDGDEFETLARIVGAYPGANPQQWAALKAAILKAAKCE